jgi:hypothetical protein
MASRRSFPTRPWRRGRTRYRVSRTLTEDELLHLGPEVQPVGFYRMPADSDPPRRLALLRVPGSDATPGQVKEFERTKPFHITREELVIYLRAHDAQVVVDTLGNYHITATPHRNALVKRAAARAFLEGG